jgi:hypothetical protein
MMLTSLPLEQRTAIYADAFLRWRRSEEDWSPPPFHDAPQGCSCRRCAPVDREPRAGTEAWREGMHRRHRQLTRGKRR